MSGIKKHWNNTWT